MVSYIEYDGIEGLKDFHVRLQLHMELSGIDMLCLVVGLSV